MPCFNQGEYIQQAINSVLAQTYKEWEIIIVNDGSTDTFTNEFLATLQIPKTTIIFTENNGVAAARNFAIQKSSGVYILPLDADDYIGPEYIEQAINIFEKNNHIKIVYAKGMYVGDLQGPIMLPEYDATEMLKQNLIFNSAVFKKTDWEKCNGYDESFLTGWEDWEFYLRLVKSNREVFKLDSVFYFYHIKKESRNANLQGQKLAIVEQQLYKKHIAKYLTYFPLPITNLRSIAYLQEEKENFEKVKEQIYCSLSYRIGHFLLCPFKSLRKVGK